MAMNKELTMDSYLESQMPQYPMLGSLKEAQFFLESKNRFAIYQINTETKGLDYLYRNMWAITKKGLEVEKSDYNFIYSGIWTLDDSLEGLYETFNAHRPGDFRGHSMSVSDVIVINEDGEIRAYYVDSSGFQGLPEFLDLEQLRLKERAYALSENEGGFGYLEIHEREEGYDYTFYDRNYREIDGGVYDDPEVSIDEAVFELLVDEELEPGEIIEDYDSFMEKVENAESITLTSGMSEPENEYKPLAKVEELEEANYNMIDNVLNNMPPKKQPYLEYYAAESLEFHDMGEFFKSENLDEVIEKYREFLDNPQKVYLGCGLGIIYRDPNDSFYDGAEVGIVVQTDIHADALDDVAFISAHPVAHEAVEHIRKTFPEMRYFPPKNIEESLYPENMTTDEMAKAISELVTEAEFYDYQDISEQTENFTETVNMALICGNAHTFIPYLKDIAETERAESYKAKALIDRLKDFTPEIPEQMEPVVEVKFCEKNDLTRPRYKKLAELDKTVADLDYELSGKTLPSSGLPETSYRMHFTIHYFEASQRKNLEGKINIGDGNGGIIGQLSVQTHIRLTDDKMLSYRRSKGEEAFKAYMTEQNDLQEHVLPYLKGFCPITKQEQAQEQARQQAKELEQRQAAGSQKSASGKKPKKSIHERLKINKELVEQQLGKDEKGKGVEVVM